MKLYVAGTTQEPYARYAKEAMEAIRSRGDKVHDWFFVYDQVISGVMPRRADAMAANKRALEESDGVLLVLPCRQNGVAEAAYAAGREIPVVVWQAAEYDPTEYEQALELVGNWSHGNLDTVLGWLDQRIRSLARGREQARELGKALIQVAEEKEEK